MELSKYWENKRKSPLPLSKGFHFALGEGALENASSYRKWRHTLAILALGRLEPGFLVIFGYIGGVQASLSYMRPCLEIK